MPSSSPSYPLDAPLYCAHCGYDLRSLPLDTVCPECGRPAKLGVPAAEVNRWAERTVVDLHCVAVLQTVAAIVAAFGLLLQGRWVGLLVCPLPACVAGTLLWYALVLVSYLRHRATPNYRNVMVWRRKRVARWLLIDGLLTAVLWLVVGVWLLS
ncbi:MAG: hypothetical protein ACYSVY_17270 [Planctomycetota bacterium]|jgi:hypothetical protein